jgi:tetratricopeptide (TPR) repeat protein
MVDPLLPVAPNHLTHSVKAWSQSIVIPTYLPAPSDKNPMFLEKRVYQGSSGKVYPLPFCDRIEEKPVDRSWKALHIENDFLRAMILPELGGRIHILKDKITGYDLIYRQDVIKPALVGLTGPWISGGIEFNWPQHHRPATFLPVDVEIENHADGSVTIWCSDHDPMCRMKGMHGICLPPDRAVMELKVRVCNRTGTVQTFLWWANVATRVHEEYQSFFPPDVHCVADHARRSMSEYPLATGRYYGVDYGKRAKQGVPRDELPRQFPPRTEMYPANDLSFYANIPTPCSYMCIGSRQDFFGAYDYRAREGLVHIANHHISPGKKQWTWGNHEFGYAWDRNLTEKDSNGVYGPYIEIMAGVYTDNQPDFSFLQPGETRSWSQYWYPIREMGPARHANLDAAVALQNGKSLSIGVSVTRNFPAARVLLTAGKQTLLDEAIDLKAGQGWSRQLKPAKPGSAFRLQVLDRDGGEIIAYQPADRSESPVPAPATQPPEPAKITSADELFITGLHLHQYRHATRCPTLYWREALRRDPLDSRCNNAMGLWHYQRGEFDLAERHFRNAINRLTLRNANPLDGEAYYNLGLCLMSIADGDAAPSTEQTEQAYAAFYKATWNQAWASAAYHAIAQIDCRRGHWQMALDHLNRSLALNTENLSARNLAVMVLRQLSQDAEAQQWLAQTRQTDRLDWWSRWLAGETLACDAQVKLDLAHDLSRAGFYALAAEVLRTPVAQSDWPDQSQGTLPLVHYTLAWLAAKMGDANTAARELADAQAAGVDYCFPARLEEIAILRHAIQVNPKDAKAPWLLGNLLYDRRRHREAIGLWEQSAKLNPGFPGVWRNLGIGYFNVLNKPAKARAAYEKAFAVDPKDARLLYERDQLWKRLGEQPVRRLRELRKHAALAQQRDDLTVELCSLLNQAGEPEAALELLGSRRFQPWEGGEGGPLGQHVRTHLLLGRGDLARGRCTGAIANFEAALTAPLNLGEAKHLLVNQSDIHYWLGAAHSAAGDAAAARKHWQTAAHFKGDFQQMSVRSFSEMTFYSALSLQRLGQKAAARKLLKELLAYAIQLGKTPATIDYFATSLPTMLLFDDNLQERQQTTALLLQAQARLGLGERSAAKKLLAQVLSRDPNHALAADQQAAIDG